ncbi:MAG TPA: DUF481 domain-containing protein [Aggregicoccus sp.]|nr:DUF481 domain-containing protein [Aggregicoccus sp.]
MLPRPLLLLCALVAPAAQAQIVNVQALFSEEARPGPSAGAELSADWRTGANDLFTVRGSVLGQYRAERRALLGVLRGEYGKSNGERIMARTLEHLRFREQHTVRLATELFLQHEYDAFRRLQARALLGAGPRVHLFTSQRLRVTSGLALMLEHERLANDAQPDAGQRTTDLRLSTYLLGSVKLMENVSLVETLYAQPRADAPSDLRLLNETALVVKANAYVSLGVGLTVVHDSRPPASIPRWDTQLRTTLGLTL